MENSFKDALSAGNGKEGRASQVKLVRSQRETKLTFILKGGIEETQDRLIKIYKGLTGTEKIPTPQKAESN